jgi:SM-20-related protein
LEPIVIPHLRPYHSGVTIGPGDVPLQLNPLLDCLGPAQRFAQEGRVHIPDVLAEPAARRLHRALEKETAWGLILNEGQKAIDLATVSQDDYRALAVAAWERAHSGFQYFYHYAPLLKNNIVFPASDHYLAELVTFLRGREFLAVVREVTGLDSIVCLSSAATLYKPLDFLTVHDDGLDGGKLVAYVLNLTPNWRPDWGGALQFFDHDCHFSGAYFPSFNALNLFRVPQRHSVSQVAAFGGSRYSVTGWFGVEESK